MRELKPGSVEYRLLKRVVDGDFVAADCFDDLAPQVVKRALTSLANRYLIEIEGGEVTPTDAGSRWVAAVERGLRPYVGQVAGVRSARPFRPLQARVAPPRRDGSDEYRSIPSLMGCESRPYAGG